MNYNYLQYFSVLAQVEHYTLAAARLGISQPSLSSAIHSLEDELGGVKLFEKVGRNVRLTEEGRYFRQKVDAALQELHTATVTLRDSQSSTPVVIRLGVVSGDLGEAAAREISGYIRQNPRVRFWITESSGEDLMDMVRQEKLDMAIVDTTNRDRSLHFRKLCQREYMAALPIHHPLAACPEVSPQQLTGEPQVAFNYDIDDRFTLLSPTAAGGEHILCTVNTARVALDLVASGVGIAFVSEEAVLPRQDVAYAKVKNWHQALYMCILYDKWLEPPVWAFVEQLVKALRREEKPVQS